MPHIEYFYSHELIAFADVEVWVYSVEEGQCVVGYVMYTAVSTAEEKSGPMQLGSMYDRYFDARKAAMDWMDDMRTHCA